MSDIVFYDFDLNVKEAFPRYISLNITKKYCGYGTFEAHFSPNEERLIKLLSENEYLICASEHAQAIVTGWRIDEDIAVFGKTPEWLMTKRAVNSLDFGYETPEHIAYSVVNDGMSDFVTAKEEKGLGAERDYSILGTRTVYDVAQEVLMAEGLGFRLYADFDAKDFKFEVYCGEERSTLFSQSGKTAHSAVYTLDAEKKATGGVWYERLSADGETREWVQTAMGSEVGARRWNAVLSGVKTDSEAENEAQLLKASEQIECGIRRLSFGTDYALGDSVRLQFEYGEFKKTIRRRICAVEIFSDGAECGIAPILEEE